MLKTLYFHVGEETLVLENLQWGLARRLELQKPLVFILSQHCHSFLVRCNKFTANDSKLNHRRTFPSRVCCFFSSACQVTDKQTDWTSRKRPGHKAKRDVSKFYPFEFNFPFNSKKFFIVVKLIQPGRCPWSITPSTLRTNCVSKLTVIGSPGDRAEGDNASCKNNSTF